MEKKKLQNSKVIGKVDEDPDKVLPIIVNVNEANYIPAGLNVRKKITSYIFTTNIKSVDITKLEQDRKVTSLAVNHRLDMIK